MLTLIGSGGMGEVYRAKDTTLGRDVALKILPASFTNDPERVARFRREAQVLASLNHPHIAQIYGLDEANPTQFLVLELVDGESLDRRIARGPIPLEDALGIARQIAEAVEAAHEKGIIHRDLKPANIALTQDGQVKVLDFGLAKAVETTAGSSDIANSPTITSPAMISSLGVILGTAAYMSPEQAKGRPADKQSDIWAFGCVLYEMLTGRRAFAGDDSSDTLAAVLKEDPDWTMLPPEALGSVRRLLRRCLEKDSRRRLRAIGDARLELDERDPDEDHAPAPRRRVLAAWLAGAALSGLALGGVAAWMWVRADPRSLSQAAGVTRLSFTLPAGADVAHESTSAVISPDGRMVVIATGEWFNPSGLWVRPVDALTARPLADTYGALLPFWSPDSQHIGFFADHKLKTVDLLSGHVQELCAAPDSRGGAWNQDDVILFAPANAGPLLRVAASGGTPVPVLTVGDPRAGRGYRFPQFLPDGDHFLAAVTPLHDGAYDIVVGSLNGSAPVVLLTAETTPVFSAAGSALLFMQRGSLVAQSFDPTRRATTGAVVPLADSPSYVFWHVAAGPAVSVSTSGSMAYVGPTAAGPRVVVFDQTGRSIRTLDVPPDNYAWIEVTPDGRRALLVRRASPVAHDLWWAALDKPGRSRLTDASRIIDYAVWDPDGERVAFSATRGGPRDIYVKSLTDPTEHLLYRSTSASTFPVSWSADGRYLLAIDLDTVTASDILVIPAAGQKEPPWPYLNTPANETSPKISPDGRWLAYSSDKTGQYELYVDTFPTPGRERHVTSTPITGVCWRRDSRELLIVSGDRTELLVAEVPREPTSDISTPRVVGHLPKGVQAFRARAKITHTDVTCTLGGNLS